MKGNIFRCHIHRKEAFATKALALKRLGEVLSEDRIDVKGRKPDRVHFDERCGFWHLTSEHRSPSQIRRQEAIAKRMGHEV